MHLSEELAQNPARVRLETKYGSVTGGHAKNGAIAFLEVPYAMPPGRFEDPVRLLPTFRYEDKEYIYEASYAVQPMVDGQSAGTPVQDMLGFGQPTENPLFLNIVIPPTFNAADAASARYPVKVYIHGGFLQFGSPHSLTAQAQFVAVERSEIHINIGYRLSVFGFLACDNPRIDGNFGFKDQWLALEWIRENIASFGGDPENITLTGISAGAHSVHQNLHHASHLPEGQTAPFQAAVMQSNAIVITPKTPAELRPQFIALCNALSLDPTSPSALETLKDPSKTPWKTLTRIIDSGALGAFGTFRGCVDGRTWIPARTTQGDQTDIDMIAHQRSGALAAGLRRAGVHAVAVGDLRDEWFLYALAHPVHHPQDIRANLLRYYPENAVDRLLELSAGDSDGSARMDSDERRLFRQFGELLSTGQVHLPVRMFARDMLAAGFPVVRYEIRWAPEKLRALYEGNVTHGMDQPIWCFRPEWLVSEEQQNITRAWLKAFDNAFHHVASGRPEDLNVKQVLKLREDGSVGWELDTRYNEVIRFEEAFLRT